MEDEEEAKYARLFRSEGEKHVAEESSRKREMLLRHKAYARELMDQVCRSGNRRRDSIVCACACLFVSQRVKAFPAGTSKGSADSRLALSRETRMAAADETRQREKDDGCDVRPRTPVKSKHSETPSRG